MTKLTKSSSSEEIKQYFNAILKLSKASEDFPINFDEVWMLVYEDKRSAIYELKDKFMQDIDFQTVRKKVQASNIAGYVWADEYHLSVPCLEFFIARKVRGVFEVYRQVFHKTAKSIDSNGTTSMNASTLYNLRMKAVAWTAKMLNLSDESKLRMIQAVIDPLGLPSPDYVMSKGAMHSATYLLKQRGNPVSALAFNGALMSLGFLEEKQRPSKSKGVSKFKCLTEKGLIFGENQVCPKNALETQPHYYDDKFDELLERLGITNKD